jgi:trehalose utilization protein
MKQIRVLCWDENSDHVPASVYPRGIRHAVAGGLKAAQDLQVETSHLDDPDQGVPAGKLMEIDVLVWWGHQRHEEVSADATDTIVERVCQSGMGFVALHSAHYSKPFRAVLGTTGHLRGGWDEDGGEERIRVCAPDHPVAEGVEDFTLPAEELYAAPFEVPPAAVTVLQSFFPRSGNYFPSGLAWRVGKGSDPKGPVSPEGQGLGAGRVFYFRPGHETLPTFLDPNVKRILLNAVRWAAGGA